jgi:hypothetical protein
MWELNKNVSTENSRVCDDGCVDRCVVCGGGELF